jgi:hypothetical protein
MDASPLNNQLKGFLIIAACLLLAIFLGYIVGTEDYRALLIGVVLVIGCWLWFFSGRFFWVLTIASSFLGGTFPILQGQFTPFQILMALGLIKFLVEDVILRRTRLKTPHKFDVLMITGFMGVIVYHAINDRLGMRFLGSDVWGGRYYVSVFVGLVAFFVIQSIPMKPGLWAKFPYVVLAVSGFDLLIAIITTLSPGSIYVIFPFYSAVSSTGLAELIGGDQQDVTGRIGAFGNFGFMIIAVAFATVSLRAIFHPTNIFRLFTTIAGGLGVLFSGYRSAILNTALLLVTTGIRDLKAGAFLLLPVFAAVLFTFSVVNSEIVTLPKQVQRGLAFFPGHWDSDMANDAAASNDFRFTTWRLWAEEFFPKHPILGRGFGFKSEWTKKSTYYGSATDYRQTVETGNSHNGLLASVDTMGLLGTLFFTIWNIALLVRAVRVPFDRRRGDYLALRFLALYLAVSIVSYWIGASSVGSFLPQDFALAGLFLRLRKDLEPAKAPKRHVAPTGHRQFRRELARA